MRKIFLLALLPLFLFTKPVFAQDFEVAPVMLTFQTDPGNIDQKKVSIRNHSNKKQTYILKTGDYYLTEDGTKKSYSAKNTPENNERSCAEWLTINPSFVEIEPNGTADIDVLMTVPANGFNTRWASIFVQASNERKSFEADKNLGAGVQLTPRIVITVEQSPKSNTNYKAKIESFTEITTEKDSLRKFQVKVFNTGDKIISSKVYLTVANLNTASEEKFEAVKMRIYPGNSTIRELSLPKKLPPGKYALAVILDYAKGLPLEGSQIMIEEK